MVSGFDYWDVSKESDTHQKEKARSTVKSSKASNKSEGTKKINPEYHKSDHSGVIEE